MSQHIKRGVYMDYPSVAAYINADSQNSANMQYRIIIRYINDVIPGSSCFFFCDSSTSEQVEFNRLMFLASKNKFTHLVTCNRDNLPANILPLLNKTGLILSVIHDNSFIITKKSLDC